MSNEQGIKQLNLLFAESDNVYFDYKIKKEVDGRIEDRYIPCDFEDAEYFVVNPVKNFDSRKDSNIASHQNFVFESDKDALEVQKEKLLWLNSNGLPFRTITSSGNKSLHAIVSLQIPLQEKSEESTKIKYNIIWQSLYNYIREKTGLELDPNTSNPTRLTRLAGVMRKDTGNIQELIHQGQLCSEHIIEDICERYDIKIAPKTKKQPKFDYAGLAFLEIKISYDVPGIFSYIKKCELNYGADNHKTIFKAMTWIADSTGCSYDLNEQFILKHLWPRLQEFKYPYSKLDNVFKRVKNYKY